MNWGHFFFYLKRPTKYLWKTFIDQAYFIDYNVNSISLVETFDVKTHVEAKTGNSRLQRSVVGYKLFGMIMPNKTRMDNFFAKWFFSCAQD